MPDLSACTPPAARRTLCHPAPPGRLSTPAFVHVKGPPGMRKSFAELVDANDRRSGVASVASRAAS